MVQNMYFGNLFLEIGRRQKMHDALVHSEISKCPAVYCLSSICLIYRMITNQINPSSKNYIILVSKWTVKIFAEWYFYYVLV